ncbi:MAG: hypothetical protein Q9168_001541 [Polycauliona sp. 1 TL-2023]
MDHAQLKRCVALGKVVAHGTEDLADLNAISLGLRDKKQRPAAHSKRKRATLSPMDAKDRSSKKRQLTIQTALSTPNSKPNPRPLPDVTSTLLVPPDTQLSKAPGNDLASLITTSNLSSFRQKVLLALCQVPRGHVTTYAAISDHLQSSARAVGNALRNNPFAPPFNSDVALDQSLYHTSFHANSGRKSSYAQLARSLLLLASRVAK